MDVSVFTGWRNRGSLDDEVEDSDVKEKVSVHITVQERELIVPGETPILKYKIKNMTGHSLERGDTSYPYVSDNNDPVESKEDLESQIRDQMQYFNKLFDVVEIQVKQTEYEEIRRNISQEYASHLEQTLLDDKE